MDDIVVFGSSQKEHDERLHKVLEKMKQEGLTLNKEKCQFAQSEIKFLGHIIGKDGVKIDNEKLEAILNMPKPENVTDLRRFLGMVNHIGKFINNLATLTAPLRPLLHKDIAWIWNKEPDDGFQKIKEAITQTPVLTFFDPKKPIKLNADSSSYGLGAVLLQQEEEGWRPVAFASRSLNDAEKKYAQMEKEALALTWAADRFQQYLTGLQFAMETDHRPLVSLLGTKALDEFPIRVQRFRLRLLRYTYTISHVPGKQMYISDALSRAPLSVVDNDLHEQSELYVQSVMASLPATDRRLEQIRATQAEDAVCRQLLEYCEHGWPDKFHVRDILKPYWSHRGEIVVENGILMCGSRIHIPSSLRLDILDKLHEGHQGIVKCRERARQSVWWPGLSKEVEATVQQCRICSKNANSPPETLKPSSLPGRPWQKVATDLFELKGTYLIVVDYYSRYIEVARLTSTTSASVIDHLRSIFARHGTPETVVSDNGPQYASAEFREFADDWGFQHITSSPLHPSGNGMAERAVATIKSLVANSKDPYAALLAYRSTPLSNGFSPSELLMNRRLRTKLPVSPQTLKPRSIPTQVVDEKEETLKMKMAENFNRARKARDLPVLLPNQAVYVKDRKGGRRGEGTIT